LKNAQTFFTEYQRKMVGGLNTCLVGHIERYNPVENKADILLEPDSVLITEIPMGAIQTQDFFIRIPYKKGDPVLVVFAQRDLDAFFHGENATPTDRMLSIDDAIGVIGLNTFNEPLPAANPDKLVIGQKDGGATIAIGNGIVEVNGTFKVNGTELKAGGDNF